MNTHVVESPSVVVPVDAANGSSSPIVRASFGRIDRTVDGRGCSGAPLAHDPGGGTSMMQSPPVVESVSATSVVPAVPTEVTGFIVVVVTPGPVVVDVVVDVGSLAGVFPPGPAVVPGTLELPSVPVVVACVAVVSFSGPQATNHSDDRTVSAGERSRAIGRWYAPTCRLPSTRGQAPPPPGARRARRS
jgi:hypothetical protein